MNAMQQIWDQVTKEEIEGSPYLRFSTKEDLVFLYLSGFVDVDAYSIKHWMKIWLEHQQVDGSFLVNHRQWMDKEKYRYNGPVKELFDPDTLQKNYPFDEFAKLFETRILSCTRIPKEHYPTLLHNLKQEAKKNNNQILVDANFKKDILVFLETYASPEYLRSLIFRMVKNAQGNPDKLNAPQKLSTRFDLGDSNQKVAATRLHEITEHLKQEKTPLPDLPTLSLKDLKPPRGRGGNRV